VPGLRGGRCRRANGAIAVDGSSLSCGAGQFRAGTQHRRLGALVRLGVPSGGPASGRPGDGAINGRGEARRSMESQTCNSPVERAIGARLGEPAAQARGTCQRPSTRRKISCSNRLSIFMPALLLRGRLQQHRGRRRSHPSPANLRSKPRTAFPRSIVCFVRLQTRLEKPNEAQECMMPGASIAMLADFLIRSMGKVRT
jgi:hypothetical protein